MRISRSRNKHRQIAYTVELSEYDAEPPTRTWLLDELPDKINPELEAVALYLIFGSWCGGEFHVPQKMGPNTASAISRHAGMDFFPGPIEYYPKPLSRGSRAIRLVERIENAGPSTFVSLGSSDWNGSLRSSSAVLVSSNTPVFSRLQGSRHAKIAPLVLMADELDARTILFSDSEGGSVEGGLRGLLSAVGLNFSIQQD